MSSERTPKEIVEALNHYIVAQTDAKKAVAIALRNRWRRMQLPLELRSEAMPKNILMIGPTGVGKTEIARRLATLTQSPFVKVEATKFTEVGYVGKDVESIIRDLATTAFKEARARAEAKIEPLTTEYAEEIVLDALMELAEFEKETKQTLRKMLLEGRLNDKEVEVQYKPPKLGVEIMAPPGMEDLSGQLQNIFSSMSKDIKPKKQKIKVKTALRYLAEEEADRLIDEAQLASDTLIDIEEKGIVFIDEIDKITSREGDRNGNISREGVQRDLLPLIEGSTVTTRFGSIKTDYILFIASGAFHMSKPSDLVPELQGRLPVRVELRSLKEEDFLAILTQTKSSLPMQYQALIATENVKIEFTPEALKRIAVLACELNDRIEDIGARRLHTLMEKLLEEVSFSATELSIQYSEKPLIIDEAYVNQMLADIVKHDDMSRYIL